MLKSWLAKQPEEQRSALEGWLTNIFPRAFDLAMTKPNVVETTKAGTLANALSHLRQVSEASCLVSVSHQKLFSFHAHQVNPGGELLNCKSDSCEV